MNANGPLHRDGLAGIEERPELRHCDLVDGGIQSAWRARDCLHEKQSGAAQGCPAMSFALSDEQRMIQESARDFAMRSEEHTSELQSLMRISYAVFCLKKKKY